MTPTGRRTIQFNLTLTSQSPELVSDSIGLRVQRCKISVTSDASHKSWVPRLPTLLSKLGANSRGSHDSSLPPPQVPQFPRTTHKALEGAVCMVTVLLERMQGRNHQMEEMHRTGIGVGLGTELLCLPQVCHHPSTLSCSPSGKLLEPCCEEFYSESPYRVMTD